MSAGILAPGSA